MELMLRWRSRSVWLDPTRTVRTLESFSRTEADGARDIGSAAGKVTDTELRGHLERHARDEMRHAELFADRARVLREEHGIASIDAAEGTDRSTDLSRGRPSTQVNAHGFFTQGLLDELGEVAYVAMLHVAEKRAASLFKVHRDLTRHDPVTQKIFADILRDEQYHVSYTAAILARWRKEGRDREISRAMAGARGGRFWSAWKRAGVRSGAGFSQVLLRALYYTLLAPFGLVARRGQARSGWQEPAASEDSLNTQF